MKFSVYELLATNVIVGQYIEVCNSTIAGIVSLDDLTNAQGLSLAVDCMATNFHSIFCNFCNYMIIIKTIFMKFLVCHVMNICTRHYISLPTN